MSEVVAKPKSTRKRIQVQTALAATTETVLADVSVHGTMGKIADESIVPLGKSAMQDQPAPVDDRLQGVSLANQVIAYQRTQNRGEWARFAREIIRGTEQMRGQFLKSIRQWLNESRRQDRNAATLAVNANGKPEPSKAEAKAASARVRSGTTMVSQMTTIANVWNDEDGATLSNLADYYKAVRPKDAQFADLADQLSSIPLAIIYAHAISLQKKERGRPALRFAAVMAKVLGQKKPREDAGDGEEDAKLHAELLALVTAAVAALPTEAQDPLTIAEMFGI